MLKGIPDSILSKLAFGKKPVIFFDHKAEIQKFENADKGAQEALERESRKKLGSPALRELHKKIEAIALAFDMEGALERKDIDSIRRFNKKILDLLIQNFKIIKEDGSEIARGLEDLMTKLRKSLTPSKEKTSEN